MIFVSNCTASTQIYHLINKNKNKKKAKKATKHLNTHAHQAIISGAKMSLTYTLHGRTFENLFAETIRVSKEERNRTNTQITKKMKSVQGRHLKINRERKKMFFFVNNQALKFLLYSGFVRCSFSRYDALFSLYIFVLHRAHFSCRRLDAQFFYHCIRIFFRQLVYVRCTYIRVDITDTKLLLSVTTRQIIQFASCCI